MIYLKNKKAKPRTFLNFKNSVQLSNKGIVNRNILIHKAFAIFHRILRIQETIEILKKIVRSGGTLLFQFPE